MNCCKKPVPRSQHSAASGVSTPLTVPRGRPSEAQTRAVAGDDQASYLSAPPYQPIGDEESSNACFGPEPWRDVVKQIWSGPESVVIHTVLLPEGLKPTDARLREGRVVSENRYTLPAGELPDLTLHPAAHFAVAVDNDCMPVEVSERGLPTHFEIQDVDTQFIPDQPETEPAQRRESAAVNVSAFRPPM
eukprot:Selendium_serpulae@DN10100_c0_g1_i1.p1